MKNRYIGIIAASVMFTASAFAGEKLGLVGIKSTANRYLQAHTDGEMHASNEHRNEEETWVLIAVDKDAHKYALQNWRNHKFLSLKVNGCAWADAESFGDAETWILVKSDPYGVGGKYAIKNSANGNYLGHAGPGHDIDACGGEVAAQSPAAPPQRDAGWPGWWSVEGATTPEPGRNFWTAIWDAGKEIGPVIVAALSSL